MILADIQPQCDSLYIAIKAEKENQHKTNAQIAQETGIAESTVGKFFSGALVNPSVYHVAAYCHCLGLSMDALFGLAPPPPPETDSDLRQQLAVTQMALKKTEEQVAIYKTGIRERKPIIYGLAGLCILLAVYLLVYITLDVQNPDLGLIRSANSSPIVYIALVSIVTSCLYLCHTIVKHKMEKKKNADNSH